jgi:predicted small secreted protein
MKNTIKLFGIIALMIVIGFTVAACNKNSIIGTWEGSFSGYPCTVEITDSRWSISVPDISHTDSGTYSKDSNTYIMQSTVYNYEMGTAVLADSATINFTLNQRTMAPGTYTLKRKE